MAFSKFENITRFKWQSFYLYLYDICVVDDYDGSARFANIMINIFDTYTKGIARLDLTEFSSRYTLFISFDNLFVRSLHREDIEFTGVNHVSSKNKDIRNYIETHF